MNTPNAQFGFMPGKGRTDALFLVRRLQKEHPLKHKRMYTCFVDLEKAFDRVRRRVMEWAMRKKGLPAVLVKAEMSLYEEAETKVRVGWGQCRRQSNQSEGAPAATGGALKYTKIFHIKTDI